MEVLREEGEEEGEEVHLRTNTKHKSLSASKRGGGGGVSEPTWRRTGLQGQVFQRFQSNRFRLQVFVLLEEKHQTQLFHRSD